MVEEVDFARLCQLANLEPSKTEAETLRQQLLDSISGIKKLHELNLEPVVPTIFGQEGTNPMREDHAVPGLEQKAVLANAPDSIGAEIRVPRIIE